MADLTNKTIGMMLVVAIVVSVSGSLMVLNKYEDLGITGRASTSGTGTTNFTIESALAIRFAINSLDFGAGYVNDTYTFCDMGSNGTFNRLACANFTGPTTNLTIENTGNVFANVSLVINKNATTFIGGTQPNFTISVTLNESTNMNITCTGLTGWINVTYNYTTTAGLGRQVEGNFTNSVSGFGARICAGLNWSDSSDSIKLPIFLEIPEDTPTGMHNATLTAYGCDDATC